MDLRTLRCFLTVAEEGSITAAALRLHMSQPPLSVRLQGLERELGVALLTRHGRGVELTDAGRVLVERARRVLVDLDATADAVRSVGLGGQGRLTLAVSPTIAPRLVGELLRRMHDHAPGVALQVADVAADAIADRVRQGAAEAGLVQRPPARAGAASPDPDPDPELELAVVEREPLVAVLPAAHPRAAGERADLQQLTDQTLIAPARLGLPGLHEHVSAAWESVGGSRDGLRECDSATTMFALVAAGLGVAIVPRALAEVAWAGLVVRPLRQHRPAVETAIVWRRSASSPVLRRFLRLALATPEPDMLGPSLRRDAS